MDMGNGGSGGDERKDEADRHSDCATASCPVVKSSSSPMNPARSLAIAIAVLAALIAAAASPYRGNTQSHVFHQSSCRYYACKNCTATFATVREAVDSGYRACGVCRPGNSDTQSLRESEDAYSGNTNTRKFHRGSCQYASCKNCTAKFGSRQEAIDAGYAPGGCCKP